MVISNLLSADQRKVLNELKTQDLSERKAGSKDPLRLKAISTSVAEFLYLTILKSKACTIAEFGTSAGYSTIHLAAAASKTGGHVYTLDRVTQKTELARKNLLASGLDSFVELFTGECSDFVDSLPDKLDFVLFDFGVPWFAPFWPKIKKKTVSGCTIFVDGWEQIKRWETEPAWKAFNDCMEADPDFLTSLLPLEKGHLLAFRI